MRKWSNKGIVTQKMMSFRLDNDNAQWLETQDNKGRYLNDLIRLDRKNDLTIRLQYNEQVPCKRLTWGEKNGGEITRG